MADTLCSGFSTTEQEVYYNKVVEKTFKLVIDRMLHIFKTREITDAHEKRWAIKVRKGYKALLLMEKHKQTGPWFSNCFNIIQQYLKTNLIDMIEEGS